MNEYTVACSEKEIKTLQNIYRKTLKFFYIITINRKICIQNLKTLKARKGNIKNDTRYVLILNEKIIFI